jgi:anaerobic magnesium-protoporphyrin IX monomethyl ester cyclase
MSKVLLIKPRFFSLDFQAITHPVGLMYIGAALKMAGHEPKIHDCALDHKNLKILQRTIKDWNPDFIGISIINTELQLTKKIMGIIRDLLPIVPVIFGGPWPSANPKEAIKKFGADFVVIGEGESAFPQLIDVINKGHSAEYIPGTASRVKGNTIKINSGYYLSNDELDALPFPAWDLLDHELYAKTSSFTGVGFRPYMSIVTSRGCPFKCTYCHQTMGKNFRKRSAESVLAEIEELRFKYGIKEFEILDDCFNYDRPRMFAILTGIKNRIGDAILHFPNALRADLLEPEDMLIFKQAGTASACFAVETYSPRLQKMIQRNLDIKKATRVINASVKAGIYSTGYFMIGFPTESYQEASTTVEFAAHSPLHNATFMFVTPLEGSKLASMVVDILNKRSEVIKPKNLTYFTNTLNVSAMSDRDLQKIFRRAYRRFYFNPIRLARLIIHHPRILSLPHYAFLFLMRIIPGRTSSA